MNDYIQGVLDMELAGERPATHPRNEVMTAVIKELASHVIELTALCYSLIRLHQTGVKLDLTENSNAEDFDAMLNAMHIQAGAALMFARLQTPVGGTTAEAAYEPEPDRAYEAQQAKLTSALDAAISAYRREHPEVPPHVVITAANAATQRNFPDEVPF